MGSANKSYYSATEDWHFQYSCNVSPQYIALHSALSNWAGDGTKHRGEILAYKEENGQHQVFYEDGEDEWVDLAAQKIATWQEPVRGVVSAPGLPEGSPKEHLRQLSSSVIWCDYCVPGCTLM